MISARQGLAVAIALLFTCDVLVLLTRPGSKPDPEAAPAPPAEPATSTIPTTTVPATTTTVPPIATTAPPTTVPLPRAARVIALPIRFLGPLPPPGAPNPYTTTTTRLYPTTTRPLPTTTRPFPTTTRPLPTTRPSPPTTRAFLPRPRRTPGAAIEAVVPSAVGLPKDSLGCAGAVCITLESQGGSGPLIINWEATSSTTKPCARFQYQSDGVIVAESPSKCSGSGVYSTKLTPNKTYPSNTYLCASDTEAADTACNYVY